MNEITTYGKKPLSLKIKNLLTKKKQYHLLSLKKSRAAELRNKRLA